MDGSKDMQNPVIIFQELKNLQEIQFGGRFFFGPQCKYLHHTANLNHL